VPLHCRLHACTLSAARTIAKVRSGGKRNRTEHARESVVRPKRQGGDDVQCVVQKASKQAARAWAHRCVQIMLLGSIVRCWSETGMNSCPDPMVRRRQPYSSALFGWLCRPKVKVNVWYTSRSRRPARTVHCYAVWYLRTHAQCVWTPFDWYLVYQNTGRQFRPLCVPRCFPRLWRN
jgi:hypothetical protein